MKHLVKPSKKEVSYVKVKLYDKGITVQTEHAADKCRIIMKKRNCP